MKHVVLILSIVMLIASCQPKPGDERKMNDRLPSIYPDYTEVTIPQNIAPLNFLVKEKGCDAVEVVVAPNDKSHISDHSIVIHARGNEVVFDMDDWKTTMKENAGKSVQVTVTARIEGEWIQFKSFNWNITTEEIDPFLTYRLIEPDYEIWNHVELRERCLENFEERNISTYKLVENRCMNCHVYANQNADLSMFYLRGENGGAILNRKGTLQKLGIKTDDMISGSVYFAFSPNGRYITFSTNIIIPAFHTNPSKRLEVYDKASDVYVADLETNTILRNDLLCDSLAFETFPTFSPDGKYIYFCSAPHVELPFEIHQLQYSLCRIGFNEADGTLGTTVDTVFNASIAQRQEIAPTKTSVCHPKISPDGSYLLYTVADYGTFPIWHPEADLQMMNLQTGKIDQLAIVNSHKSDTYHSWSSNSRWFVFASKRDDGLYGKPYFCYIDKNGTAHKPFCLPQKSPAFYDQFLKSFNAPELGKGKLPFTAKDVQKVMKQKAEPFK